MMIVNFFRNIFAPDVFYTFFSLSGRIYDNIATLILSSIFVRFLGLFVLMFVNVEYPRLHENDVEKCN